MYVGSGKRESKGERNVFVCVCVCGWDDGLFGDVKDLMTELLCVDQH